jgi:hypothetical protein
VAEQALLHPGQYHWDLLLRTAGGVLSGPYVAGVCTVADTITVPPP